jgi:uncharacterized protein YllA (UPF0747 family)
VILRGLFQETILPNIAFTGGGGEIAYWLEFKALFEHYQVPYPLLILRNSFLIVEKKWKQKLDRLGITIPELFNNDQWLMNTLVRRASQQQLTLVEEINNASEYYDHLKNVAARIDDTLIQHVGALQTKAIKPLQELEKKLLRAERRKFETQQRQVQSVKQALFPLNSLQERIENFMPFYAKWGKEFINIIYEHSLTLEQEFGILTET